MKSILILSVRHKFKPRFSVQTMNHAVRKIARFCTHVVVSACLVAIGPSWL